MHVPDNRDSDVGKQYSTESNKDAIRGMMMGDHWICILTSQFTTQVCHWLKPLANKMIVALGVPGTSFESPTTTGWRS